MNSFELSRNWFNFCFDNPELIKPIHSAVFFFAIEHCNRLGWKEKFGFPSQMTMEAIGVKKHQTYSKALNDLIEWGFIELIERSRNQWSANIIRISAVPKNGIARGKALDKATTKHGAKQRHSTGQSTGQSTDSIVKPINHKPLNQETNAHTRPYFQDDKLNDVFSKWLNMLDERRKPMTQSSIEALQMKLNRQPIETSINQIQQSLEKGWLNLRPIEEPKQKQNTEAKSFDDVIWTQADVDRFMNDPFIGQETKEAMIKQLQDNGQIENNLRIAK